MATRVSALNSTTTNWNDYDLQSFHRDHVDDVGDGCLNVDRSIEGLQNGDFAYGSGSVSADGWIGDINNSWYGELDGATATLSYDAGRMKIDCTVNSGAQTPQVRLTEEGSSFTNQSFFGLLKVKPNTTYKIKANIETLSVSSGNSGGASVRVRTVQLDGSFADAETGTAFITGTAAAADVEFEFTTGADAKYIQIFPAVYHETGTAWFDNLDLVEVGDDLRVVEETVPTNTVEVSLGVAFVKINKNSTDYVARFEVTTAESVTITANVSGNPRKDLVIARIDTVTNPDINAANVGILEVIVGTPGGSPVAPALPANAIPLAVVDVANGQTVFQTADITDARESVVLKSIQPSTSHGAGDFANKSDVKQPATAMAPGILKMSVEPQDYKNPIAVSDNDPRNFSEAQKTAVLNSLGAGNTSVMPAGENIVIVGDKPVPGYFDATTGKIKQLLGSSLQHQNRYAGFILDSGNGNVLNTGFDSGDPNEFYHGANTADWPTLGTAPSTLTGILANINSAALASSNDVRQSTSGSGNGEYAYQLFQWDVSDSGFATSTLNWIEVLMESNGGGTGLTDGWDFYAWNETDSTWDSLGESTLTIGSDESVENRSLLRVQETLAKYVNLSDQLYVLLKSKGTSNGSNAINLNTDFTRLTVSQGVSVQTGGVVEGLSELEIGRYYFPSQTTSEYALSGNPTKTGQSTLGNAASQKANCTMIGTNVNTAGFLKQFTLELGKVNSGQTVYVYVMHDSYAQFPSGEGQGWPGATPIYRSSVAAGTLGALAEYVFTVNKYLPAGRVWIMITTETQGVNASNYVTFQRTTGFSQYWYQSGVNWFGSSTPIWVKCETDVDWFPDPAKTTKDVTRNQYIKGAIALGKAVSTTGLLLKNIDAESAYNTSPYSFSISTNDAINNQFTKFTTQFRPRRIRVVGFFNVNDNNDEIIVGMWNETRMIATYVKYDNDFAVFTSIPTSQPNWFDAIGSNTRCGLNVGFIEDDGFTLSPIGDLSSSASSIYWQAWSTL